jgi:hypothetical protein
MSKTSPKKTGAKKPQPGVKNLTPRKAAGVKGGSLNTYITAVQGEKQGNFGPKK